MTLQNAHIKILFFKFIDVNYFLNTSQDSFVFFVALILKGNSTDITSHLQLD